MMAGDIQAYVDGAGNLHLKEVAGQTGLDNSVWVSREANGSIRVRGHLTQDGSVSWIDGQDSEDHIVTGNLYVDFGGGRDTVVFDATAKPTFQEVHIHVGATSAMGNSDDDDVMILGAVSRASMYIHTGAGNDRVNVTNASIGAAKNPGNLVINTGSGQDEVDVTLLPFLHGGIDIETYTHKSEADVDDVAISNLTMNENLSIRLGGGNDNLALNVVAAYQDINIETDDGRDTASLQFVNALDELMANMGDGSDNLELYNVTADDLTALGGGGVGTDSLRTRRGLSGHNTFNTSTQTGWEWINGLRNLDIRLVNEVTPVRRTLNRL